MGRCIYKGVRPPNDPMYDQVSIVVGGMRGRRRADGDQTGGEPGGDGRADGTQPRGVPRGASDRRAAIEAAEQRLTALHAELDEADGVARRSRPTTRNTLATDSARLV